MSDIEKQRLHEAREHGVPWKKWGPYLSERQWGTVREDYSDSGDAWNYFSHDQARSRAYRWGEDGIAGISDDKQLLCFALALWNGKDPILKERLFGLTNSEGNHGEDVKEYYFYLDSTPTHSYMKYLYKYPQREYPYHDLTAANKQRTRNDLEYELLDTGIFDDNRYFDVYVEYAKESPEEILIRISLANRGPEAAEIHVLPTLWFRNTWASWSEGTAKPVLKQVNNSTIEANHREIGKFQLVCDRDTEMLFTENETNNQRVFGSPNPTPYVKDGINNYVVNGHKDAVNPEQTGTKASPHYRLTVGPGETSVVRMKLIARKERPGAAVDFGRAFESIFNSREGEADEFYRAITPPSVGEDAAMVMRQALGGMLWSKQYYSYEVVLWLAKQGIDPRDPQSRAIRNKEWFHAVNEDIISMPDKWEYPWYAAWDLAFHTISLSMVDLDFAKEQLDLMLRDMYIHPSGQIPAYEWNFSDVNPPVHAWASMFVYDMEKQSYGQGDLDFLKRIFGKLMVNFTWWVNRKDRFGKNVFEGGFLGLDNIGVFDRSAALPTGGHLEQADGTAWMSMYCQNMLEIAAEIATYDPTYQELATKFIDHFLWIAEAMNRMGGREMGLWDEEDGFYYDVLRLPDGRAVPLKVRSMVGLLPLCATTVIEKYQRESVPRVLEHSRKRLERIPGLLNSIHATGPGQRGVNDRGILALVNHDKLQRILSKLLDENEFLSPHGIRALSRFHVVHPYVFNVAGQEYRVDYLPAESDSGMFGGNSNWRGPIWLPVNVLIIRALLQFYLYYGDTFKVECPTGSGNMMNLFEVGMEISRRLERIFLRGDDGRRPVYGGAEKFQTDPYWRDNILFYEYFHGDNGAGLGASHQTGWTGLIARLIRIRGASDAQKYLQAGKRYHPMRPEEVKVAA
ncbi:MAG: glucosidase [Deltaproteobacteria bacterium HGW-Deltaproteobacteria-15]|nr:MAG: glucosidase [Deltaproteobacteria bacterium HGW-Deltaproteobacteria-15]